MAAFQWNWQTMQAKAILSPLMRIRLIFQMKLREKGKLI